MKSFPVRPENADFARRLLAWYRLRGRSLPWRRGRDPYRIWLSEIMLQQTGVATVIPYFERFLDRFPDLAALAAADPAEVISLWSGLGYYSRARNLHAAAQLLMTRHQGNFPEQLAELTALPGIGRSTAGAIAAIAFGKRAPILDGNVRRILCRLFALETPPTTAASQKQLWAWAEELTPVDNLHDYSQAVMDLGATVCTPRNPDCGSCPVSACCLACQLGRVSEFPVAALKKKIPTARQLALVLKDRGQLLLRKRPYQGFLGGLWEFPNKMLAEGEQSGDAAARMLDDLGLCGELRHAGEVRHAYSHFRLVAEIRCGEVTCRNDRAAERGDESCWFAAEAVADLPLHGAHRKIVERLKRSGPAFDPAATLVEAL